MKNRVIETMKRFGSNPKAVMITKVIAAAVVSIMAAVAYNTGVFAAQDKVDFSGVTTPIVGLINSLVNPLLLIIGAGGMIFCIMLGVKYATAEEPQEKEKRKQALKTAIIGYFLIFILVVALKASIGPMSTWMNNNIQGTQSAPQITEEGTTQQTP